MGAFFDDTEDDDVPKAADLQPWLARLLQTPVVSYPDLSLNTAKKEIRLLHLKPGVRKTLHGFLEVVSLADEPKYEALSHTWGASEHNECIHLSGGVDIAITDNLATALRQLRHCWSERVL
ncbi:hypothetical protein LTR85_006048 [Meristemomyces frigidus]|nr:hypothetical protein LTR85_006048 [Meristemomyces frigidus]